MITHTHTQLCAFNYVPASTPLLTLTHRHVALIKLLWELTFW